MWVIACGCARALSLVLVGADGWVCMYAASEGSSLDQGLRFPNKVQGVGLRVCARARVTCCQ